MSKKIKFNYFDEFIVITECILKSIDILKETFNNFNVENLEDNIKEVHKLENKSDSVVYDIRNNLIKDFLPPIDREDIAILSKKLDNIEDGIDEVIKYLKIFNIVKIKEEVMELINVLILCCKDVNDMFLNLNSFKNVELINEKVIQINKLEDEGDLVYEKLITSLYKEDKDSINVIKWTKIYNCLEETIDVCDDVSDCIADIVMKNT